MAPPIRATRTARRWATEHPSCICQTRPDQTRPCPFNRARLAPSSHRPAPVAFFAPICSVVPAPEGLPRWGGIAPLPACSMPSPVFQGRTLRRLQSLQNALKNWHRYLILRVFTMQFSIWIAYTFSIHRSSVCQARFNHPTRQTPALSRKPNDFPSPSR